MKNTTFFGFLRGTPKNLRSIIIIWAMCIAGITVSATTWNTFDPQWTAWGVIVFLLLIMYLAVLRVWLIWKRL